MGSDDGRQGEVAAGSRSCTAPPWPLASPRRTISAGEVFMMSYCTYNSLPFHCEICSDVVNLSWTCTSHVHAHSISDMLAKLIVLRYVFIT